MRNKRIFLADGGKVNMNVCNYCAYRNSYDCENEYDKVKIMIVSNLILKRCLRNRKRR